MAKTVSCSFSGSLEWAEGLELGMTISFSGGGDFQKGNRHSGSS